jgi:murein DD-endopeptidase MepM/ murein hydrolase activator NlpD
VSHPGPAQHVPPPPGVKQPGTGTPTQQAGFINVQGRLYAPLQGLNPDDVLSGGYGWLAATDNGATLHCGVDLNSGQSCNSDEGLPVVAPLAGVVRRLLHWDQYSSGEGNHLWLELLDDVAPGPTWVHFDHLQAFAVGEGQRVIPGQVVAYCGRSGNWDCAHLHTELLPGPPAQGWYQWPYGWSQAQVEAAYYWPRAWWDAAVARVGQAPPEIVSMILSGAQAAAVQAVVWGNYWRPGEADFAIQTSWRDEWRRGVWRGAPLSDEQLIPEDPAEAKPAGSWRLFEHGAACWLPGPGVSWNG